MKRKQKFLVLFVCLFTMFLTVGCSLGATTLEKYVENNKEAKESISDVAKSSGLDVEIKDNDVVYTYDVSSISTINDKNIKDKKMVSALEDALNSTSSTFSNLCKTMEDETKIDGIRIIVKYVYKDSVVVEKTFTSNDK